MTVSHNEPKHDVEHTPNIKGLKPAQLSIQANDNVVAYYCMATR